MFEANGGEGYAVVGRKEEPIFKEVNWRNMSRYDK